MSYSQRAKTAKADRNFKIPTGRYKGPLKSYECKPNSSGNMMMTVGYMPAIILSEDVKVSHPDLLTKVLEKKKEARNYMTLHNPGAKFNPHAGFEEQLIILADAGYNVDQCRPLDQDPNYEDFKSLWHQMMTMSPMFTFDVKWEKEDDQFPKVRVIEVEPHPTTLQQMTDQTAVMAAAVAGAGVTVADIPAAPAMDIPPAPAPPAYTGPTRTELRAAGWNDAQIEADPNYKNAPEA